ncbi:tetratricopeptide repeat protein [Pelagibacteraceae bacterium]|nr:tetratricopeptide repeat protein [Pelagibacteraceae bacterium]
MKRKEIYPKNHLNMRVIFKILIVSISLLFASKVALADQNDPRLNNLFKKLNETENQDEIRDLISDIWNIWYEVDDPKVIEYFEKGIQAMNLRNYPLAIRFFNNLIEEDPNFAEGWNKRATVHFMMGNFDQSMQDIIKTLELEPRHFGALDGMGLIFIHQGQFQQAIDVYDKMLEIFPFSVKTMDKKERIQSFISQST